MHQPHTIHRIAIGERIERFERQALAARQARAIRDQRRAARRRAVLLDRTRQEAEPASPSP